ncbi:uncharacterized protein LOC143890228 [Tasmannia lanceolata]|uniref:uncharacterized protein LOC143890228 n=1 Tax=Tasmannia lanceolata TaxID=3420 RepID=UPI0040648480
MEALRKLEEKWNLTPPETLLVFVCVILGVVGLCAMVVVTKRRVRNEQRVVEVDKFGEGSQPGSGWGAVKKVLMGSGCWCGESRLGVADCGNYQQQKATLVVGSVGEGDGGARSSPISPLWQRRILMGERCELPRHSGLILYDERGRPLHQSDKAIHQEKIPPVVTTTLRDLL